MTNCWPMTQEEEGARPQILCSLKETHREEKILSLPLGIVVSLPAAGMEVAQVDQAEGRIAGSL